MPDPGRSRELLHGCRRPAARRSDRLLEGSNSDTPDALVSGGRATGDPAFRGVPSHRPHPGCQVIAVTLFRLTNHRSALGPASNSKGWCRGGRGGRGHGCRRHRRSGKGTQARGVRAVPGGWSRRRGPARVVERPGGRAVRRGARQRHGERAMAGQAGHAVGPGGRAGAARLRGRRAGRRGEPERAAGCPATGGHRGPRPPPRGRRARPAAVAGLRPRRPDSPVRLRPRRVRRDGGRRAGGRGEGGGRRRHPPRPGVDRRARRAAAAHPRPGSALMTVLALVVCGAAGAGLAKLLRIPLWPLIGAIIGAAAFHTLTGEPAQIPRGIEIAAQVVIGTTVGSQLGKDVFSVFRTVLVPGLVAVLVIIGVGVGLGLLLNVVFGVDILVSMFGMVPGGVGELVATVTSLGGDSSVVAGMHLVRLMVVLSALPLLMTLLERWLGRRGGGREGTADGEGPTG
ncbi:hypothetical protein C1701_04220 [Actinoalloteichus sp. AHMU CJ021]|nr:hypothetical protein C1701_04220 [Actinoalloteichus sp. AHMU CJ021]